MHCFFYSQMCTVFFWKIVLRFALDSQKFHTGYVCLHWGKELDASKTEPGAFLVTQDSLGPSPTDPGWTAYSYMTKYILGPPPCEQGCSGFLLSLRWSHNFPFWEKLLRTLSELLWFQETLHFSSLGKLSWELPWARRFFGPSLH